MRYQCPEAERKLRLRVVHHRLDLVRQAFVLHIANHSHDFSGRILILHQDHESFADGVFVRKELPRHRLVDHESQWRLGIIIFVAEGAALPEWNIHGLEVMRLNHPNVGNRLLAGRWPGAVRSPEVCSRTHSFERQKGDRAGIDDTRQRANATVKLSEESHILLIAIARER